MRALASALALTLFVWLPARAAEPPPQYSPQQLEKDFSKPQSTTSDACAAQGMVTAADGSCQPSIGRRRGFSLASPDVSAPPPTGTTHARTSSPAVAHSAQRAAPEAPPPGRDLLITFANGSAELTAQAKANARVFAQVLNSPSLRGARFAIEGHTNAVGARDYNLTLSRDRAQALVDFLASQGVDRSRFDVTGYGFDRPADARNPAAAGNRRVEARRLN
jgi:outer membrane protein OmpA-like peptidoglycan-associated protein